MHQDMFGFTFFFLILHIFDVHFDYLFYFYVNVKIRETRNGAKKPLLKQLLTIGDSARPLQSITESKPL